MPIRFPFFALAFLGLVSGIWAGLLRLGFDWPGIEVATLHGPLMVGGFVGTLISIERSILSTNGRWWIVPLLSGASVLAWLLGLHQVAPWLLAAASALLVALQVFYLKKTGLNWVTAIQLAGALCFLTGNFRLLFNPLMPAIVPFWMGFVLCFILATRLSENNFKDTLLKLMVRAGILVYLAGLLVPFHLKGYYLTGSGLLLIAFGMLLTEVGGDSNTGWNLSAYTISCISAGWCWLLLTGIGLLFWHDHLYGYDATVHAFFLGFLFSMVFVHALGKAAALAGLDGPPFHRLLFLWPALLSLSLLLRIFGGDILLQESMKKWAGLFNGISILGFLISLVALTLLRKRQKEHVTV